MADEVHSGDGIRADRTTHRGPRFRTPVELTRTPISIRAMVIGSCTSEAAAWHMTRDFGWEADHVLFNSVAELPAKSDEELAAYSFQYVQLALRAATPEQWFLNTNMDDPSVANEYFEQTSERLRLMLDSALAYNRQTGMLTFVANYPMPQQNLLGRFMPRYEMSNPVYFVEELNRRLVKYIAEYQNVHLVDYDAVVATQGRMYIQDDSLNASNHSGLIGGFDYEHDRDRIEPPGFTHEYYDIRSAEAVQALIYEIEAMFRTLRGIDGIKLVIIDLDDTLWRGVAAEGGTGTQEGWPLGFTEALVFLKRRGIVLAIVSKNDEATIREQWGLLTWGLLPFESFAVHRINWRPKSENVAEVIAAVNVLPESVVFIDDNPVERAAVAAAFPQVRVLGADPYYLRRVLLWSAQLQTPTLTTESGRRTEMIRAQAERQDEAGRMSRESFLASLDLKVQPIRISSETDLRAPRAFELLSKTNQFNTTGRRWTEAEWARHFAAQGLVYAFEVQDRFSQYGLTCVAVMEGATILQFVMSCRVIGLEVERRALEIICDDLAQGGSAMVSALAEDTAKNLLSRDLYAKAGFQREDGAWVKRLAPAAAMEVQEGGTEPEPRERAGLAQRTLQRIRRRLDAR
ncbi:HAD-IIIC family phosphatase [Caulobacter sp. S45]|uniref:HAD-IIIC family phosphatase n=1 Tax=Caulobacter sp. S45 TaxID=1641861 RepID=UPI0015776BB5|nr:HAD-IIIC family phosphatase [Caulobacter sp. S45]